MSTAGVSERITKILSAISSGVAPFAKSGAAKYIPAAKTNPKTVIKSIVPLNNRQLVL